MRRGLMLALLFLALVGDVGAGEVSPPAPEAVLQAAAKSVESGDVSAATDALLTLDAERIPEALRTQVDLLLGIALLRQMRIEEAVVRLQTATAHPLLADYALYNLGQAQRQAGRRDLAAEALRQLVDQHPQSVLLDRAQREMPRDYLEAGQLSQAEEAATKFLAAHPTNSGRAEMRLTLGEILLRAGRNQAAEDVLRRLWLELPASPESQRAQDLLTIIPGAGPFTADEQFRRAATLYNVGRHALAIPELAPFAVAGSPREAQARLMLGISAFHVRQYGQAAQWLEPLKDSAGPERVDALFWLGRSAGRAGDTEKFTQYLTLVVDTAPRSRRGEEALYLLAQAAADDADVARSRAYLRRLLQEYPKGFWTDVALWLQGWFAYKQQEFPAAAASWGHLVAEESGSRWRTAALYWRGRALEAVKHRSEAIQVYRTLLDTSLDQHYYRRHANERLATLTKTKKKVAPRSSPPTPQTPTASGVNGLHARKARALRSLGLTDDAVEEWSEQVRSRPEERAGLAEACAVFLDLGRYDKAVWVGNRILRPLFVQADGQPPIPGFWQCAYPLGHIELVRQYTSQRGVDPYLVLALIREESAFAPHAVSRTGARGLMQLMPQTADRTAREHRLPLVTPDALEVPDVNIPLGVNHLADLLREFGGNLSLSLASYNAGKQPVQRWLQRFGFADEVEFVEEIPFSETRNYVKRVLGNYERYSSLYGTSRAETPSKAGRREATTEKRATGGRQAPPTEGGHDANHGAKR
jgi:soluble lytic murein transglycosylase